MNRPRLAFVMVEMMVAAALFTVFSVVAVRLVFTSFHIARGASEAEVTHRAFDAAVARLRLDVWSAASVDVRGPGGVTLASAGGVGTITWNVAADGALVRTTAAAGAYPERQSWAGAGRGVTFRLGGGGGVLVLDVPKSRGHDNGTYRLYSQILLAREPK